MYLSHCHDDDTADEAEVSFRAWDFTYWWTETDGLKLWTSTAWHITLTFNTIYITIKKILTLFTGSKT